MTLGKVFAAALVLAALRAGATELPKPAGPLWNLGRADARMIESGWAYEPKRGAWSPQVVLRLVNRDPNRPFHAPVRVEFIGPGGRVWLWKTFVALGPGAAQHRSISAGGPLDCAGPPPACPNVGVRVALGPRSNAAVWPIRPVGLVDPMAPPAGWPLYVASVGKACVIRLLDGRRVRPLGILFQNSAQQSRAVAWTWGQVMDAPIELTYDGQAGDRNGIWHAYIALPGGRDLGMELLSRGLAVPDFRASFSRRGAYLAAKSLGSSDKAAGRADSAW